MRSRDMSIPEKINLLVTDAVSDYLFLTEESGMVDLQAVAVDMKKVFFVGDVRGSMVY